MIHTMNEPWDGAMMVLFPSQDFLPCWLSSSLLLYWGSSIFKGPAHSFISYSLPQPHKGIVTDVVHKEDPAL